MDLRYAIRETRWLLLPVVQKRRRLHPAPSDVEASRTHASNQRFSKRPSGISAAIIAAAVATATSILDTLFLPSRSVLSPVSSEFPMRVTQFSLRGGGLIDLLGSIPFHPLKWQVHHSSSTLTADCSDAIINSPRGRGDAWRTDAAFGDGIVFFSSLEITLFHSVTVAGKRSLCSSSPFGFFVRDDRKHAKLKVTRFTQKTGAAFEIGIYL